MSLTFRITFRGPFAVSTGKSRDGMDLTIDEELPLPPSAIKGLLRAELVESLRVPASDARVERIFGTPAQDATWWWGEPEFKRADGADPRQGIKQSARTKVDEDGLTERGFLAFTEVSWEATATVVVEPEGRDDSGTRTDEELLLRAAARSVSALGSDRRRGKGWVRIVDLDPEGDEQVWTDNDTRRLLQLIGSTANA